MEALLMLARGRHSTWQLTSWGEALGCTGGTIKHAGQHAREDVDAGSTQDIQDESLPLKVATLARKHTILSRGHCPPLQTVQPQSKDVHC